MADSPHNPSPPSSAADGPPAAPPVADKAAGRRSRFRGMFDSVRQVGRDVVSVAIGRLLERPKDSDPAKAPPTAAAAPPAADTGRRLGMLHSMAEQLRGAADTYVAAKLDEIEARVDQKLDAIEGRIDRKIIELHRQLADLRDRELRHRLRLLKITLILAFLVAVLSLLYKWLVSIWHLG